MSLEVKVGPLQIAIHQGHVVLLTGTDGQMSGLSQKGYYFYDTRVISHWTVYANGEPWDLLNGGATAAFAAQIFLTNRAFLTEAGPIEAHTVGLTVSREISGGLHEDLDVINYGTSEMRFNLEIGIRSDFADLFEVKSGRFVRRGRISTAWSDSGQRLLTTYRNEDFLRAVEVSACNSGSLAAYANGRMTFDIAIEPGARWHCCLRYDLSDGRDQFRAPVFCASSHSELSENRKRLAQWNSSVLKLESNHETLRSVFQQATDDLAALRLPIKGSALKADTHVVPAAGLPWFVALFGRDSLITSLQTSLVYPSFARGTLEVLGARQAKDRDDYRDAEPGKIMHELRLGELAPFQPGASYALLRNGRRDAALSHYFAYRLVLHRRP